MLHFVFSAQEFGNADVIVISNELYIGRVIHFKSASLGASDMTKFNV